MKKGHLYLVQTQARIAFSSLAVALALAALPSQASAQAAQPNDDQSPETQAVERQAAGGQGQRGQKGLEFQRDHGGVTLERRRTRKLVETGGNRRCSIVRSECLKLKRIYSC